MTLANLERLVFAAIMSVVWLDSAAGVDLVALLPALDMPPAAAAAEADASGCSCSSCVRDRHSSESTSRVPSSSYVTTDVRQSMNAIIVSGLK